MFIKERTPPIELKWLPRLLRRLPRHHSSWPNVEKAHYMMKAGYGGEIEIDRRLRHLRWKDCLFIGDLQLSHAYCQIDTIVLTPYFALILEVKNYSGTLIFDEESMHLRQITRQGQAVGYHSPVTQAWNAREELLVLFGEMGVKLPVDAAIVLPYSTTLVENMPKVFPVIYGHSLNRFISSIPQNGKPLPNEEIVRIGQLLLEKHSPFPKKNYSQTFKYAPAELKKGILCHQCGSTSSRISTRTHYCSSCNLKISGGLSYTLDEWFAFASPKITNSQCREFLMLRDKNAAHHVLTHAGLTRKRENGQFYYYK